jgi:hypothetical protein
MDLAKIESLSKSFASIVIPVVLLVVGQDFAAATKQREIEAKFVEMATAILNKDPGEKPSAEVQSLRKWAVEIIDKFSGVPMPRETATALIQNTPLPSAPAPAAAREAASAGPWAVVFGGDTTLDAARHEVKVTAGKMGLENAAIYRRGGSYRSIATFGDRSAAEEALGKARSVRADAYLVDLNKWCPVIVDREGYRECGGP